MNYECLGTITKINAPREVTQKDNSTKNVTQFWVEEFGNQEHPISVHFDCESEKLNDLQVGHKVTVKGSIRSYLNKANYPTYFVKVLSVSQIK